VPKHTFHIKWADGGGLMAYALDVGHAERELEKLSYSNAPIRFLDLFDKDGDRAFVNLAHVATVCYEVVADAR